MISLEEDLKKTSPGYIHDPQKRFLAEIPQKMTELEF
jgi:hypothetical protein